MADRFYTPDRLTPGEYALGGSDAHHLASVRRFGPSDRVILFNGDGHDYPATVVAATGKRVLLNVEPGVLADRERPSPLWVASAIPKGDRADYLIEKLTELGATRFTPLICERSIVLPKASTEAKFRKQVVEASKQCGRNRLMQIDPGTRFVRLCSESDTPTDRWLLHTNADAPPLPVTTPGTTRLVAIGPEGGFSPDEVDAAIQAGWQRVSLGPRILRIETAAVVACGPDA